MRHCRLPNANDAIQVEIAAIKAENSRGEAKNGGGATEAISGALKRTCKTTAKLRRIVIPPDKGVKQRDLDFPNPASYICVPAHGSCTHWGVV